MIWPYDWVWFSTSPISQPAFMSLTVSPSLLLSRSLRTLKKRSSRFYSTNVLDSHVHRGTRFESRALALLEQRMSMTLRRVGGKGDGGMDLIGWWWLPHISQDVLTTCHRRRIRIIAQCKAEKKKIGPKYIRELEGVLHRYHTLSSLKTDPEPGTGPAQIPAAIPIEAIHYPHIPSIGLFLSESPFTKATVVYAQSSLIPLLLIHLPPDDQDGALDQSLPSCKNELGTAIWNSALAGDQGLLGGGMEIRWERSNKSLGRPGLWWKNVPALSAILLKLLARAQRSGLESRPVIRV
ncbi:hypothetical protein NP233_g6078 [Leucocoprinus birnbaumii]|uniref:Required for respiratory growth protein 7, mitochondrial n=1 Tax=Leucocoprinus birnbaumii TaxID=56174 RepID=A0AAD5VRM4_9AGAR|nr:hypothetical protein NP233_g6078 [Leucocoprinus birnbaumii]